MQISSLIYALLLTIAVECLAVFILGYRKNYQIYIIALLNIITNPALNYILMLLRMTGHYASLSLVVLEAAVVFIEWWIMLYAFKTEPKRLLMLSAAMNGASYAVGVLIMG